MHEKRARLHARAHQRRVRIDANVAAHICIDSYVATCSCSVDGSEPARPERPPRGSGGPGDDMSEADRQAVKACFDQYGQRPGRFARQVGRNGLVLPLHPNDFDI